MGAMVMAGQAPHYELRAPMEISARLLPAVRVADAWVSVEAHGVERSGRVHWRYFIDSPAGAYASGDSGLTNVPNADHDWTRMAARALATVCAVLGVEDDRCEWLPAPVEAWRREHAMDFMAMAEELGGE